VLTYTARFLKREVRNIVEISTLDINNREEIFRHSQKAQSSLHRLLLQDDSGLTKKEWSKFLPKLGLVNSAKEFRYGDEIITTEVVPPIQVYKIRPIYRVGREGKLTEQVLVTITQTFRINNGALKGATFRGGCTLLLNMSKDYSVEYIIYKKISSESRFKEQMDYQQGKTASFVAFSDSMYDEEGGFKEINFAHLHFD
jgi:hypothetical protein